MDGELDLLRPPGQTGDDLVALAHQLGRSRTSISGKAVELNLSGTHPNPNGARRGRPWTESDDQILRANYGRGRMKTAELARLLDRPAETRRLQPRLHPWAGSRILPGLDPG